MPQYDSDVERLEADIERLEADIERLEVVKARAIKVVEQTTPDAAYARHDDLIAAIEAAERYI